MVGLEGLPDHDLEEGGLSKLCKTEFWSED